MLRRVGKDEVKSLPEAKGSVRTKQAKPLKPDSYWGGTVGAEPLNSAPGAEEGSLASVQGSDGFDFARRHLNPA